jgi:signal transduction histidine kinase
MNGYQVCRLLKDDPEYSAVPVVILTSRDLQSDRFRGIASGADAYLVKNLEDDQLLLTVRAFLSNRAERPQVTLLPRQFSEGDLLETINRMLDRRIFTMTVTSQVEAINAGVADHESTVEALLDLYSRVFEFVVGGVAVRTPIGALIHVSSIDACSESFCSDFIHRMKSEIERQFSTPAGEIVVKRGSHPLGVARLLSASSELTDCLFLPLHSQGNVAGLIGMGAAASLKFDNEGKELLDQFVRRAEIVLDNAGLLRERDYYNHQLSDALQQLKAMQAQLVHSEKMASLGVLLAGLTHELNNPITFIGGNLDILERNTLDLLKLLKTAGEKLTDDPSFEPLLREVDLDFLTDDLPDMLKDLRSGVDRTRQIIADLRTFAAPDRGGMIPTDLREVIESTLNILRHQWQGEIDIVRDYRLETICECQPGQIGQVVLNLISNAIFEVKENGNQGKITILLQEKGGWIEIQVSDNGRGIDPDNLSKLFQPFFTTKEVGKGIGLGLSISYGIVQQHHGEILVTSEKGVGSTFTVRLPHPDSHLRKTQHQE